MTAGMITDIVIIGIVLLSALFALSRGLVREVLSVASWVVAVFVTLYGHGPVRPYVADLMAFDPVTRYPVIADLVTGAALFLGSLFLFSLISHQIGRLVQSSAVGALDRSLGFLFGMARGVLIVVVLFLGLVWTLGPDDKPEWFLKARSLPLVEVAAAWSLTIVPETIRANLPDIRAGDETGKPPVASENSPGYTERERTRLDRLFEGVQ